MDLFKDQKCVTQLTLINLHPNEYSPEFQYYLFAVKLGRYIEICNPLTDLSNIVCVPKKEKI